MTLRLVLTEETSITPYLMSSENSTPVFRCDTGISPTFELSPEGYLKSWAKIARTGVQLYQNPDGTIRREYRPPEEVGKIDSLKSFQEVPICFEHPPVLLSAENAKSSTIGWTSERVVYNGGFVETGAKIIDGDAIKAILSGEKGELSAGYSCLIEMKAGVTPTGEAYDCIQREIRGNHVAITERARGGAELKLISRSDGWNESIITFPSERLDSLYIEVDKKNENNSGVCMDTLESKSKEELIKMIEEMKAEIKGKDKELKDYMDSSAYYQGIVEANQKLDSADTGNEEKFTSRLIAEQARAKDFERKFDSATKQLEDLAIELKRLEEKNRRLDSDLALEQQAKQSEIKKAKQSWLETYEACKDYLPHMDSSIVDLSPVDMMRLAIENSCPSVEITSDDPTYIKGMFDLMKKGDIRQDSSDTFKRNLVATKELDSFITDSKEIRQKQIEKITAAWQIKN